MGWGGGGGGAQVRLGVSLAVFRPAKKLKALEKSFLGLEKNRRVLNRPFSDLGMVILV